MSINNTHISGNLARDCKAFKNEDGKSTVYFTVACGFRALRQEGHVALVATSDALVERLLQAPEIVSGGGVRP